MTALSKTIFFLFTSSSTKYKAGNKFFHITYKAGKTFSDMGISLHHKYFFLFRIFERYNFSSFNNYGTKFINSLHLKSLF
jgi:hypothetical protein